MSNAVCGGVHSVEICRGDGGGIYTNTMGQS